LKRGKQHFYEVIHYTHTHTHARARARARACVCVSNYIIYPKSFLANMNILSIKAFMNYLVYYATHISTFDFPLRRNWCLLVISQDQEKSDRYLLFRKEQWKRLRRWLK